MEELTENAEEPDEGESKQSEQKLGKLQYKVLIGFNSYLDKIKTKQTKKNGLKICIRKLCMFANAIRIVDYLA